ncbi:hypothetical protein BDP27DRAFT_1494686 [Rhodocollybia butyracea]|uniref:Uncharacterized protein n=1 Tax=Rhodocollybia butyracea TaxID=206335 RepID=A0A9P5PB74_9AGAR|nr:hypothetical protein BDP27DRAFT_1494686 [Rhodocollybia butyracea]
MKPVLWWAGVGLTNRTRDGEKYAGEAYHYDKRTGIVSGNPAHSHLINTFQRIMKTKAAAKGVAATRNHAEAMTVKDVEAMVGWVLELRLYTVDKHGDLTWNCCGLAPDCTEHFKVHLENRKGWQKKVGYDPHPTDNMYDIYLQPVHAMDMHYHLPSMGQYSLNKNSLTMTQSLIQEASAAAGVAKTFTTHSLHRGRAQYRFMWAEGKQRWSLTPGARTGAVDFPLPLTQWATQGATQSFLR